MTGDGAFSKPTEVISVKNAVPFKGQFPKALLIEEIINLLTHVSHSLHC